MTRFAAVSGIVGDRRRAPAGGDPFERQLARLLPRDLILGRVQMAQPAEAVQLLLPRHGWRHDLERRFRAHGRRRARKAEIAIVKLDREARIAGAKILREDKKMIGGGNARHPARKRSFQRKPERGAPSLIHGQRSKTRLI